MKNGSQKPTIIPQGAGGTKVLRGRDVDFTLRGHIDPRLLEVLTKIAEINHTNTLAVAELATMFNKMVDTMNSFADVAHNMKEKSEQFERAMTQAKAASEGDENS